jgi:hypothetical protein
VAIGGDGGVGDVVAADGDVDTAGRHGQGGGRDGEQGEGLGRAHDRVIGRCALGLRVSTRVRVA